MPRQDDVFDPGTLPEKPLEDSREVAEDSKPAESFRDKALRRAREQEEKAKAAGSISLDHWPEESD